MMVIPPVSTEAANHVRDLIAILADPKRSAQTLDELQKASAEASEKLTAVNVGLADVKSREDALSEATKELHAREMASADALRDREMAVAAREREQDIERRDLDALRNEVNATQADATAKLQRIEQARAQFAQQLQTADV